VLEELGGGGIHTSLWETAFRIGLERLLQGRESERAYVLQEGH
jgi:hypothetical protein